VSEGETESKDGTPPVGLIKNSKVYQIIHAWKGTMATGERRKVDAR
jgi:hypothetical protein